MTVSINWTEEEHAEIDIICDACSKEYVILSREITNLHLCSFCGHYHEVESETGEVNETEEDSWD